MVGTSALTGPYPYNVLSGAGGNDQIVGGDGQDFLSGGEGNDTLRDGDNLTATLNTHDNLNGGNGDDVYILNSRFTTVAEGASGGIDVISAAFNMTLPDFVENLVMTDGYTSARTGTGNALGNFITGNQFVNVLLGLAGNDLFYGNAGTDTLQGGSGYDTFFGGSENDFLSGGNQNNLMSGDAGADTLLGGSDSDSLYGGTQNDVLQGGTGRDVLFGGANADVFAFLTAADSAVGANRDMIADFRSGLDKIDLPRIAANQIFINSALFSGDGLAEMRYDKSAGILAGDSDGDGSANWQISLRAGTALTETDLIL